MERIPRAVVLTELMARLRAQGSWCGEGHLQPAVYFLQELFGVPCGFAYVLYFYSPYSFDLAEELEFLRACFLVEFDHHSPGFGPAIVPTAASAELRGRFPKTLARYGPALEFVVAAFNSREVAELVRLATALYVTRQLGEHADAYTRSARLRELNPHANPADALAAVEEVDRIAAQARSLTAETAHA